jgi:ATP-dependent RNA helicase RhlE
VLRGIRAAGFETPRPIQARTIPAVLEGRDVLGLAQTGTGKTAAFALPILSSLIARGRRGRGPRALILAPTRELASQIDREIGLLGGFTPVRSTAVYGGVTIGKQIRALEKRPDILVACPGRLLDLHQRRDVDLSDVEVLVLDEADHMFDMGFLPSIRRILAALPERRQNLLFSATMPREIRRLTDQILRNPHVVELEHSSPADTIEHALYPVAEADKQDLLEHLFRERDFRSAIVFLRTKSRARRLAERLARLGHAAVALQGNMSQSQRDRAMQGFRDGRFKILVATDIAARGIDVEGISHVINFDVPNTPDAYTHRIGRTGRSERHGKACTFITNDDRDQVRAIEKKLGDKLPRVHVEGFGAPTRGPRRSTTPAATAAAAPGGRRRRDQGERGARSERGERTDRRATRAEPAPAAEPSRRPSGTRDGERAPTSKGRRPDRRPAAPGLPLHPAPEANQAGPGRRRRRRGRRSRHLVRA